MLAVYAGFCAMIIVVSVGEEMVMNPASVSSDERVFSGPLRWRRWRVPSGVNAERIWRSSEEGFGSRDW